MKLQLNQNVFFIGEELPMKVMAISERYAICYRKLHRKEDDDIISFEVKRGAYSTKDEVYRHIKNLPVYTILDFEEKIRGADSYIFGIFDYSNPADCKEAIQELENEEMEISYRNRTELKINWKLTTPQ